MQIEVTKYEGGPLEGLANFNQITNHHTSARTNINKINGRTAMKDINTMISLVKRKLEKLMRDEDYDELTAIAGPPPGWPTLSER